MKNEIRCTLSSAVREGFVDAPLAKFLVEACGLSRKARATFYPREVVKSQNCELVFQFTTGSFARWNDSVVPAEDPLRASLGEGPFEIKAVSHWEDRYEGCFLDEPDSDNLVVVVPTGQVKKLKQLLLVSPGGSVFTGSPREFSPIGMI